MDNRPNKALVQAFVGAAGYPIVEIYRFRHSRRKGPYLRSYKNPSPSSWYRLHLLCRKHDCKVDLWWYQLGWRFYWRGEKER